MEVCAKAEPHTETADTLEALDTSETKLVNIKIEVNEAEEQVLQFMEKKGCPSSITSSCNMISSKQEVLGKKQLKSYLRGRTRVSRSGFSTNTIINYTSILVKDFYLMSQCQNSVYCSMVPIPPTEVMCNQCGRHFTGSGNRILKLFEHIEAKHKLNARNLLLGMIERYSALLEQMKKFLHKDQAFIANHFD